MKGLLIGIALASATTLASADTAKPAAPLPVPAGAYTLEKAHASLLFKVDHLGFSNYTARFKNFDAQLQFDPAHPTNASVTATVDVKSLETDYPYADKLDFNAVLQKSDWLDGVNNPTMTFRSKKVEAAGGNALRIIGELTLRGITKPMTLDAVYNGGYAGHPMDPHARIGFSAHGTLKRSEYGMTYGIPEAGSKMGVGDAVDVIIEAEFSGPPLPGANAGAHP